MTERILSFGAGVNSTALLVLYIQKKIEIDEVIFADTGSELPETYEFIENVVKPLCLEKGVKFTIVGSASLYEDYYKKRIFPYRMFRSCTDRYKIRPIKKYLKGRDYVMILGIDAGETKRAKEGAEYPLIEHGIDRQGCIDVIKGFGIPVPVKSGCFFCPFTKLDNWKELLKNHRDLFMKAEKLEKNCSRYPEYTITQKPLEQIRKAIDEQKSIKDWINPMGRCLYCHQ